MDEDPLRDHLSTLIGKASESGRVAADPVSAAQIRRWLEAFGHDGGVDVAPRAMLAAFSSRGLRDTVAAEEDRDSVTRFIADLGLLPAGVGIAQAYARDIVVGDRVRETTQVESVSPRKTTKLGAGYFVTMLTRFVDERERMLGEQRITLLAYLPDRGIAPTAGDTPVAAGSRPAATGETLPPFSVTLDRLGVIACATACGDFAAGHYDPDIARARGFEDIFTDVYTGIGFVHRFVSQWAGPGARVSDIDVKLGASFYAGDTLRLAGTAVAREDGAATVAVQGMCRTGLHISGTARLEPA